MSVVVLSELNKMPHLSVPPILIDKLGGKERATKTKERKKDFCSAHSPVSAQPVCTISVQPVRKRNP
jgi:hypothetical protein